MFNKLGSCLFFLLLVAVVLYGTKFAVYDKETRIDVAPVHVVNCKVIRILCFGDSLTSGFSTTTMELHPYSKRLQECFDSNNRTMLGASLPRPIFEIHNAGMPGERAKDQMFPRLNQILQRAIVKYSWVIILAGTNDMRNSRKDSSLSGSRAIFSALVKLHNISHTFGAKTVAVSIPDRECERSGTCPNLKETHKKINALLRDFTSRNKEKVILADLASEIFLPRDKRLWSDSLHFTKEGYTKMANIIYSSMKDQV
ncbi:uncharacterized protein LOC110059900 [Orbicella faveolata]|uniref:uncharacterized protein LOC110059900 n=1 Tax=Orbicella faveolata TaxID=48498 RepID=UPI0009E211F6|nr:uncharacterized protein LOC110059900 [Orbicella faveolata]